MANIAIIGGGFTGLVAAYRLQQAGHQVTIFERNTEVGGLAAGVELNGTHIERAYHHIFKTDTDIINFVHELGLDEKLHWFDSSLSVYWKGKFYPFVTPLDLLRFTPLPFFDRIRAGLMAVFLKFYKNWEALVPVTAYSWLLKWAGPKVTEVIWEPLLRGKFHTYFDKVSMAWFWARVHIRANSREGGGSQEKLGYFEGGFNVIVQELVRKLQGVKIITGAAIEGIVGAQVTVGGQAEHFDQVIATTPSRVFAQLVANDPHITPKYLAQLSSIEYLGAICLIFTSGQSLSEAYWHNINELSAPFLVFIQHTNLAPKEWYGGKNVYYIGAYLPHEHELFQLPEQEVIDRWLDYLPTLFPDFDRTKVEQTILSRLKFAQHIVDTDFQGKIPAYQTPIPNVWLANFSQIFPEDRGTNYAVREGHRVAGLLLKSLKPKV